MNKIMSRKNLRILKPFHSSYEFPVTYFQYQFIKSYLYRTACGIIKDTPIRISQISARNTQPPFQAVPLRMADIDGTGQSFISEKAVQTTIWYDAQPYDAIITSATDPHYQNTCYMGCVVGMSAESAQPRTLFGVILREAIRHSPYSGKHLTLKPATKSFRECLDIEVVEVDDTRLADIFTPPAVKDSLKMFVECIRNYDTIKQPMRYLINGRPGTGKTKMIRSVISEASGKATFILTSGGDDRVDSVFQLARCFSPVVVCIDDVDLLAGHRNNGFNRDTLGKLLQYLDGFISEGMFVLATTNDKMLVDKAANRPGRFDMILDVNPMTHESYLDFVQTKTGNTQIADMFADETVVAMLEARKVTGAFIATLIKNLEIAVKLGYAEISLEYVTDLIRRMDIGFHKDPDPVKEKTGFEIN